MSAYDSIAGDFHPAQRGITNRFSGEKETYSFLVNEAGKVELWIPNAGKQITLYWVAMNTPESNTEEVKATIELPPWFPYTWYLGAPGAFMHWEPIVGEVGAPLIIELSVAQQVAVSFTITEDFPRNE